MYKGEPIKFQCLICGQCCRDLLRENSGLILGLALTRDEAKLFPQELISPAHGRGKSPLSIYAVTMYQLNVDVCPFLGRKNTCRIYDKRPLTCRRFPLVYSSDAMSNIIAPGTVCKFIKEIEDNLGYTLNYLFKPDTFLCDGCWQAHRTFARLMERNKLDARLEQMNRFNFNLQTKQWVEVPILTE